MSYEFYKILHIIGVLMVFASIGATVVKASLKDSSATFKREISITHGVGLLLALVAGFGILAKLGLAFKGWVVVKMLIWLFFGGATAMAARKPDLAKPLWFASIGIGILAAYLAIYKPF
jgi:hypothetical protein